MNRRKAVFTILGFGLGGSLIYPAVKWHDWYKSPDYNYLHANKPLLAALVECIIPATDTPGAKETGTHEFIVNYVNDCADVRSANLFIDGLQDLQAYSRNNYDKPFQDCKENDQINILTHFEQKGKPWKGLMGKVQQKYLGKSFFTMLKELTVEGYCTSELGATRAFAYEAVPGSYQGHLMMQKDQKAWATK
jgi:hypothetical protein